MKNTTRNETDTYKHRENSDVLILVENVLKNRTNVLNSRTMFLDSSLCVEYT